MYQVIFTFENGATPVTATAAPGETLLETARAANVAIDAPCSGNGSCGKCRVKLLEGTVEGLQTSHITDEDYAAGWRLSCASKVSSDVTVMVPDIASAYQSRMKTADLSTGEEVAIFTRLEEDLKAAGVDFSNDFVETEVAMEEPTLEDTMPDTERLTMVLEAALGCDKVRLSPRYISWRGCCVKAASMWPWPVRCKTACSRLWTCGTPMSPSPCAALPSTSAPPPFRR